VSEGFQVALAIHRCHTARACGCDCLPIDMILNIAGCKDTGYARSCPEGGLDISAGIQVQLVFKETGVWGVADGNEHSNAWFLGRDAGLDVPDSDAGDDGIAQNLLNHRVPDKADLGVHLCSVLHDLRCAKRIPPVDHGHMRRELRQEVRLFHGRIAAPDDHEFLAFEEKAVAGSAGGHPMA
jgi:hypothetical protein